MRCDVGHCNSALLLYALLVLATCTISSVSSQLCYKSAVSMRFKPFTEGPPTSFLSMNNQSNVQMLRSRTFPPIIIQILDSNGNVDASDSASDVRIVVTSTTRLSSVGTVVPVVYGEAQITQLVVEGTDPFYNLTFTASSSSPLLAVAASGAPKLFAHNITNIQIPVNIFALRFAKNNSALLYERQPLTIVVGRVVPQITLNVLNSQYLTFPTAATLGSNYSVVVVPSDSRFSIVRGGAVPVLDGEAIFDDLVITGPGAQVPFFANLTFQLYDAATLVAGLSTCSGQVTVATAVTEYTAISFERQDTSFIGSVGQNGYATAGVALPPIRISLRNNLMQRSPDASGVVITATISLPSTYSLRGTQVGVVNGVATFADLTLDSRVSGNIVIRFTAGSQGSLPLAGATIQTGWITVFPPPARPATYLQFQPNAVDSFLNYPGQKAEVVLFSPIPAIRIQILNSSSNVDTTTTLSVTVTASAGVQFTSTTRAAEQGVVSFENLQFTSASSAVQPRLTFTASSGSNVLAAGTRLVSGVVSVAASQPNYALRFQKYGASLLTTTGQNTVATINVPLPKIIIEILTSAGNPDTSSSDISIVATCAGATLSGAFMRVSSGVAIFDSLMFVSESAGTFVLTFTAGSEGDAPVAGKSLLSGNVRVAAAVTPAFGLRFHASSYIQYEGHVVPIAAGTRTQQSSINPIAPVVIEMIDSAHNVSTSTSATSILCVYSSGTEDAFQDGRRGVIPAGQSMVEFRSMTIRAAYAPTITCTATVLGGGTDPVNGARIASGALLFNSILTPEPLSYGSIRVGAGSLTAGNRQPGSVNLGSAMVFNIELFNILGNRAVLPLPQTQVVRVSVSCSIPLRAPLTADMRPNGVATFSALQFAQSAALATASAVLLTFSASVRLVTNASSGDSGASTTLPYRIDPISTGVIRIIGPSAEAGIDVVAQILFDYSGFDAALWIARLSRLLNVETARFLVTRKYYGTGADPSPSLFNTTANAVAVWFGTRLDFRIIEPQATSRNTKPAWAVANAFLSIKTDCSAAPQLYLRHTANLSSDSTCDWYVFDDQLSGAQQCVLAAGTAGFCACYVDMIATYGLRCLGYNTLTDLCLETLIGDANCQQAEIVSVCSLLQAAPVSRVGVFASGLFFAFLLVPLYYFKSVGYFHKIQRPEAHASFPSQEKINLDESELL